MFIEDLGGNKTGVITLMNKVVGEYLKLELIILYLATVSFI